MGFVGSIANLLRRKDLNVVISLSLYKSSLNQYSTPFVILSSWHSIVSLVSYVVLRHSPKFSGIATFVGRSALCRRPKERIANLNLSV